MIFANDVEFLIVPIVYPERNLTIKAIGLLPFTLRIGEKLLGKYKKEKYYIIIETKTGNVDGSMTLPTQIIKKTK